MKPAKKGTQKSRKSTTATREQPMGFTDEERVAMRERIQELKADGRLGRRAGQADGDSAVLAKIAALPQPDRAMAERLPAIIKADGPALSPKTWYGMPPYAKDGNVACFFQSSRRGTQRSASATKQVLEHSPSVNVSSSPTPVEHAGKPNESGRLGYPNAVGKGLASFHILRLSTRKQFNLKNRFIAFTAEKRAKKRAHAASIWRPFRHFFVLIDHPAKDL